MEMGVTSLDGLPEVVAVTGLVGLTPKDSSLAIIFSIPDDCFLAVDCN